MKKKEGSTKNMLISLLMILFNIIIAFALFFISDYLPGWLKIDLNYSKLIASLVGIINILLAIYILIIQVDIRWVVKNEIENAKMLSVVSDLQKQTESLHTAHHLLLRIVNLDDRHEIFAKDVIENASKQLKLIEQDRVWLDADDFFTRLKNEFASLKRGDQVLAVNAFETTRWEVDPRERKYFEENQKAILRGATIERIFILSETPNSSDGEKSRIMATVLKRHAEIGVAIFVVYREQLGRNHELKDAVLFKGKEPRLYEDFQDQIDKTRISHGELHLNDKTHDEIHKQYKQLKDFAVTKEDLN